MSGISLKLGPIGLLFILLICIVLVWLYGLSIIIGIGLILLTLFIAKPAQISNYKTIWFWLFILGIALVILSAMGLGFQFVNNQIVWVGI